MAAIVHQTSKKTGVTYVYESVSILSPCFNLNFRTTVTIEARLPPFVRKGLSA
jgi:hypothetical protein